MGGLGYQSLHLSPHEPLRSQDEGNAHRRPRPFSMADEFQDMSFARQLTLECELYHVQSKDCKNSLDGLTCRMQELWDDLVVAGGDITSTRMDGLLLFKLPVHFDSYYRSVFISNQTTFPTWDEVLPSLR